MFNTNSARTVARLKSFWVKLDSIMGSLPRRGELAYVTYLTCSAFVNTLNRNTNGKLSDALLKTSLVRKFFVFFDQNRHAKPSEFVHVNTLVDELFTNDRERNKRIRKRLSQLGIAEFLDIFSSEVRINVRSDCEWNQDSLKQTMVKEQRKGRKRWKKSCAFCGKIENENQKVLCCSKCSSIYYCGKKCQRKDWKQHKTICKRVR